MNDYTYQVIKNPLFTSIRRIDSQGNDSWIPADPANSDYQQYLASLESNLPEVKETPETPVAE